MPPHVVPNPCSLEVVSWARHMVMSIDASSTAHIKILATLAQGASRLNIHGHGHLVKEEALLLSAPSEDVSLNPLKAVSGLISLAHQ